MPENEKDRKMDALLDSLLENYSAVDPRPGLETRIRARMRAHAAERRRAWTVVFAASAAIIVFAAGLVARRDSAVSAPVYTTANMGNNPIAAVKSLSAASVTHEHQPLKSVTASHLQNRQSKTAALLQLANAVRIGDLPEESEDQSIPPAARDSDAGQPGPVNQISIQNLGVDSIEIKELAPPRSDDKGNL